MDGYKNPWWWNQRIVDNCFPLDYVKNTSMQKSEKCLTSWVLYSKQMNHKNKNPIAISWLISWFFFSFHREWIKFNNAVLNSATERFHSVRHIERAQTFRPSFGRPRFPLLSPYLALLSARTFCAFVDCYIRLLGNFRRLSRPSAPPVPVDSGPDREFA